MKKNPLKEGAMTENSAGIGTVTREMVQRRARELAAIDGRNAQQVSRADWDMAKEELMSEPSSDPTEAALEMAPESDRWNPVAGSFGHSLPLAGSEDEDADGRSDNERLVNEGVAEAGHEQMRLAAEAREQDGA